jgi:hypothetical protein
MILTVTVSGMILATAQAFTSRFAVKCSDSAQALRLVESELDWSEACISRSSVDGHMEDSAMPQLPVATPCHI